jgi:hypothetical protein
MIDDQGVDSRGRSQSIIEVSAGERCVCKFRLNKRFALHASAEALQHVSERAGTGRPVGSCSLTGSIPAHQQHGANDG